MRLQITVYYHFLFIHCFVTLSTTLFPYHHYARRFPHCRFHPFLPPSLQLPPCVSSNKQQQLKRQLQFSLRRPCRGVTCSELLYLLLSCSWRSPGCCVLLFMFVFFLLRNKGRYDGNILTSFFIFPSFAIKFKMYLESFHSIPQSNLNEFKSARSLCAQDQGHEFSLPAPRRRGLRCYFFTKRNCVLATSLLALTWASDLRGVTDPQSPRALRREAGSREERQNKGN